MAMRIVLSSKTRWSLVGASGLAALVAGALLWRSSDAAATPPPQPGAPGQLTPPPPATPPAVVAAPPSTPSPHGVPAPSGAPGAVVAPPVVQAPTTPVVPTTARIEFMTIPPTEAWVRWGKQRLGQIGLKKPLVVIRPRDSGPLDVVVTAEGFLPVHTRAHTFADSKVMVKLTTEDQKMTLLGYRAPIDAGIPMGGEGGAGGAGGAGGEGGGSPPALPMPTPQAMPPTAFDGNGMPRLP